MSTFPIYVAPASCRRYAGTRYAWTFSPGAIDTSPVIFPFGRTPSGLRLFFAHFIFIKMPISLGAKLH